jgi:hypothetical protein
MDENLRRLADRVAIQEALARYARGIDRRDWDILRSAYHPDAIINQAGHEGGVEALIAGFLPRHSLIEQAMHMLTNCLIEFDTEDSALAETYYLAWLRAPDPSGDGQIETRALGRYVDRFERREGEWRIARRTTVSESVTVTPAGPGPTPGPGWAMPHRGPDDPLFVERRRVGLR